MSCEQRRCAVTQRASGCARRDRAEGAQAVVAQREALPSLRGKFQRVCDGELAVMGT